MNDHRHMRDLMIAFTAIVLVWSIACGLTFTSVLLFGRGGSSLDGPTALIGDWLSHEDLRRQPPHLRRAFSSVEGAPVR
jgi:hypothetical protein